MVESTSTRKLTWKQFNFNLKKINESLNPCEVDLLQTPPH